MKNQLVFLFFLAVMVVLAGYSYMNQQYVFEQRKQLSDMLSYLDRVVEERVEVVARNGNVFVTSLYNAKAVIKGLYVVDGDIVYYKDVEQEIYPHETKVFVVGECDRVGVLLGSGNMFWADMNYDYWSVGGKGFVSAIGFKGFGYEFLKTLDLGYVDGIEWFRSGSGLIHVDDYAFVVIPVSEGVDFDLVGDGIVFYSGRVVVPVFGFPVLAENITRVSVQYSQVPGVVMDFDKRVIGALVEKVYVVGSGDWFVIPSTVSVGTDWVVSGWDAVVDGQRVIGVIGLDGLQLVYTGGVDGKRYYAGSYDSLPFYSLSNTTVRQVLGGENISLVESGVSYLIRVNETGMIMHEADYSVVKIDGDEGRFYVEGFTDEGYYIEAVYGVYLEGLRVGTKHIVVYGDKPSVGYIVVEDHDGMISVSVGGFEDGLFLYKPEKVIIGINRAGSEKIGILDECNFGVCKYVFDDRELSVYYGGIEKW